MASNWQRLYVAIAVFSARSAIRAARNRSVACVSSCCRRTSRNTIVECKSAAEGKSMTASLDHLCSPSCSESKLISYQARRRVRVARVIARTSISPSAANRGCGSPTARSQIKRESGRSGAR
jgi:hypothetical protein